MKENENNSDSDDEFLSDFDSKSDYRFKIVLIGNSGVGKTCLVNRAKKNIFLLDEKSTLGIEFYNINVRIHDKIINLQVWDTCGQEQYKAITKNYYAKTSLAIIIYDISSSKSFNDLKEWIQDLKRNTNPNIHMYLVGNKNDVNEREVKKEIAESYSKKEGFINYIETSAESGENCKQLFIQIAKFLYEDLNKNQSNEKNNELKKRDNQKKDQNIKLGKEKEQDKNNGGGCCIII